MGYGAFRGIRQNSVRIVAIPKSDRFLQALRAFYHDPYHVEHVVVVRHMSMCFDKGSNTTAQ